VSVDHGFGLPFCALWYAHDPGTSRIYRYRKLYRAGFRDEDQARLVVEHNQVEWLAMIRVVSSLEVPKVDPRHVARQTADAIEAGAFEVLADETAHRLKSGHSGDVTALYPHLAALATRGGKLTA
jgi:hypothetical protein